MVQLQVGALFTAAHLCPGTQHEEVVPLFMEKNTKFLWNVYYNTCTYQHVFTIIRSGFRTCVFRVTIYFFMYVFINFIHSFIYLFIYYSTSLLAVVATKSHDIARSKQAVSCIWLLSGHANESWLPVKKMNETLSLEDETAILADGPLGGCTCFPQGNLVQLLTDVTSSMSTMSASLHNVAHKQGDNDAESASKRASPSPASGISSHVNDLLLSLTDLKPQIAISSLDWIPYNRRL